MYPNLPMFLQTTMATMATIASMAITPMVTDTATAGTTEVQGVSNVDFNISVEGFDPTIKKKSCQGF